MEIETKNASLDTLVVTIRALHVSGKQMTLAVFRQLPQTHAYTDDGYLWPMTHWGLVRYTIKDEGSMWLVAEHKGILYRCKVDPPFEPVVYLDGLYRSALLARERYLKWETQKLAYQEEQALIKQARAEAEKACPFPVQSDERWDWINDRIPKVTQHLTATYLAGYEIGQGANYLEAVKARKEAVIIARRAWELRETLLDLPQLFIAV